jgi:hypothetical protein
MREMMREVPRSPERLRKAQKQREVTRKAQIQRAGPKKGTMDEVVRDGVRVPPQSYCDQRDRWPRKQQRTLRKRKRDRQRSPGCSLLEHTRSHH